MADTMFVELIWQVPFPDAPANAEAQWRDLCAATLARVGLSGDFEVSVVLTDDTTIQHVNQRMRGHDAPTDVLSFPLLARPLLDLDQEEAWAEVAPQTGPFVTLPQTTTHLGDIMMALPTIRRQAAAAKHDAWWECCYLLVHGMLHLIGYDDATEAGYRAMVAHQEAILQAYQIAPERG